MGYRSVRSMFRYFGLCLDCVWLMLGFVCLCPGDIRVMFGLCVGMFGFVWVMVGDLLYHLAMFRLLVVDSVCFLSECCLGTFGYGSGSVYCWDMFGYYLGYVWAIVWLC